MSPARIVVEDVDKAYGSMEVLRQVSFRVEGPCVIGVLGPNGVGKTTLVRLLAGLHGPDSGTVRVLGSDPRSLHPRSGDPSIGYVPQDLGIYPTLTVDQNLRTFAGLHGADRSFAERRGHVAEFLALEHLLERPARALSGGEQRRVHVAAALLHEPTVLLVDEPTVGADVSARHRILDAVRELADVGTTVIYTTHYLSELEAIGDDVLILSEGQLVSRGSPAELIARHGQATVEVTSAKPIEPSLLAAYGEIAHFDTHRVVVRPHVAPGVALGRIASHLGNGLPEDCQIELRQPSLEQAYMALVQAPVDPLSVRGVAG